MNYIDPENTPELLESLRLCPTIKEVKDLIDNTFEGWIITALPSYSVDYPHFTSNWEKICKITGATPAQIIIVKELNHTPSHTLMKAFCDILTHAGFIVRQKSEIIPCSVCSAAIPSHIVYTKMKESGVKVPDDWRQTCRTCF